AVAAGDGGAALYGETLRPGLAAQGLLGLHLPESLGGQGYGLPELAIAVEELGRSLLPGAFLPTVLASAILHSAVGDELNGMVKDLAGGTLTGAVGFAPGIRASRPAGRGEPGGSEPGRGEPGGAEPGSAEPGSAEPGGSEPGSAEPGGDEPGALVIDGSCGPVPGAGLADLVVLPVALDGEDGDRCWVVVDAADVEITQLDSLDLVRPACRVRVDRLSVPSGRV